LRHELLELKLLEDAVLIAVEAQKDILELDHVVHALSEKLLLHFSNNLVHAVSPVGHACGYLALFLSEKTVFFDFDFS